MSEFTRIREFLAGLPEEERREALSFLVTTLLGDAVKPGENLAVYREDGTLVGHIVPLPEPSAEDALLMSERGRRVDPKAGRPTSYLLERMQAEDAEGVRKFVKKEGQLGI